MVALFLFSFNFNKLVNDDVAYMLVRRVKSSKLRKSEIIENLKYFFYVRFCEPNFVKERNPTRPQPAVT